MDAFTRPEPVLFELNAHRHVAFLRGINLGRRRPPMPRLKSLFEELGFDEVDTFIASGNVVFSSKQTDSGSLESRIARHLERSLGYGVDTFVRTAEAVIRIGGARVFPEDGSDGITIHVGFLQQKLSADIVRKLVAIRTKVDEFQVVGREIYWLCRVRTSESKAWTLPAIKALHLPTMTLRNLTSIRKLVSKHLC